MSFSPLDILTSPSEPFTDYSRWRLVVDEDGRHSWTYLRTDEECAKWPQKPLDKFWMGLPTVRRYAVGLRTPLTSRRICPIYHQRKPLSNLHETDMNTTNIFKRMMVTGLGNTVDLCFLFQGLPLGLISLGYHSPTKNVAK